MLRWRACKSGRRFLCMSHAVTCYQMPMIIMGRLLSFSNVKAVWSLIRWGGVHSHTYLLFPQSGTQWDYCNSLSDIDRL